MEEETLRSDYHAGIGCSWPRHDSHPFTNREGWGRRARSCLLNRDRQQLRTRDHVIERLGRSLADRRFTEHGHILSAAHSVHHIHYRKWKGWHHLVRDHGFGVLIKYRNINTIVHMLFVQDSNGRSKIEPLRAGWIPAKTVEHVAIAHQNPHGRALGSRGRNANWYVFDDCVTAIGTQENFNRDLIARASFADIGARTLEPRRTA